jgi:hypothetical protein
LYFWPKVAYPEVDDVKINKSQPSKISLWGTFNPVLPIVIFPVSLAKMTHLLQAERILPTTGGKKPLNIGHKIHL